MTLDYESDKLVSFCGAVILLIPSLLAVSCISKKVPEPAANKEEIEGKKKKIIIINWWTDVFFLL